MLLTAGKLGCGDSCVEQKGFTAYVWMQSFEVNPYVDEKGDERFVGACLSFKVALLLLTIDRISQKILLYIAIGQFCQLLKASQCHLSLCWHSFYQNSCFSSQT
jgi:hypothetical protein